MIIEAPYKQHDAVAVLFIHKTEESMAKQYVSSTSGIQMV
jgi:hypothetical protein